MRSRWSFRSTSTDTQRRSWSKGAMATRWNSAVGLAVAPGASQSATSSGLPPTAVPAVGVASLHTSPSVRTSGLSSPVAVIARSKLMWPSVRVPVLSVNSTSMSPRSSMHTSRLTSTFFSASRRDPVARLVETTAGSSCGVMPTATASENRTASMTGRPRATLITKIVTLSTPPTLANSPEKRVRPSWNSVWGWRSTQSDGDPPELGRGARSPPRQRRRRPRARPFP